jgi:phospholipid/cholesterol/gamma-HCH transport system permease protein
MDSQDADRTGSPIAGSPIAGSPIADGEPGLGAAVWRGVRDAAAPLYRFVDSVGGHFLLLGRALSWLPRRPFRAANYLDAGDYIGFGSLPIILLVGAFTGMVTSLQTVHAFRLFGLESITGGVTGKSLALELGPVLTCLMLSGRAGAGIATELGTMRITEQIDALESMAVNPIQFLVLPRLIMGTIMAPVLALIFFIVGMVGAYFVAVVSLHVDHGQFLANFELYVKPVDVLQGLIKSGVFGLGVMLIACYQGFHASGGGRGVGLGTTRAVVLGSVAVLVLDYFVTDVLLALLPAPR